MSALLSLMWFIVGIIFVIAGKPFMEVAACFLLCGIFEGCFELYEMRKSLEDWEDDV